MAVNHYERAAKIWDVLVEAASNNKKKTYKEISEDTKIHWRAQYIPLGFILNPSIHCSSITGL